MTRSHRQLFAIVTVAAVGVGIAGAIFGLADPYGFRPMPYADPDRLVRIEIGTADLLPSSPVPTVEDWQARGDLFDGIAAYEWAGTVHVRTSVGIVPLDVMRASENFFTTLGVGGANHQWQSASGTAAIPIILGASSGPAGAAPDTQGLTTDAGTSYIVVSRLPDGFVVPEKPRDRGAYGVVAYEPDAVIHPNWSADGRQGAADPVGLIARLQTGVTPEAVARALGPIADGRRLDVRVTPLTEVITGHVRTPARAAVGLAGLLLLLCAANIANLWTTRFTYRLRELETRRMLGASMRHIVRLLATEYLAVVAAVCLLALGICGPTLALASGLVPPEDVTLGEAAMTMRVAVGLCLAAVAVIGLGMMPAAMLAIGLLRVDRFDTARAFAGLARARQLVFVAAQAALAMVLVIGSGALLRSTAGLFSQPAGYDADVLFVPVIHGVVANGNAEIDGVLARLRRVPGVHEAAATIGVVTSPTSISIGYVSVDGVEVQTDSAQVTETYFGAAGMRLVAGRLLGPQDASQTAVVVDRAFTDAYWPGERAVGRLIFRGDRGMEVVGVVDNVLRRGLAMPARPTVYQHLGERPIPLLMVSYVAKVDGDPGRYAGRVRQAIVEAAPNARISAVATIGGKLADSVRAETFATLVLGLFAMTGTVVCLTGTAAVVAVAVARRRREVAVRLALGSTRRAAMTLVLRDAAVAGAAGALAGIVAGRWLVEGLQAFVHGVEASAWSTTMIAAGLLFAATAAAALVPALRVREVRPAEMLRME